VNLGTNGFQGWVSDSFSVNIGGPSGLNTNYMVGVYNNTSYNDYFGFNLSSLGSDAKVTSATLIVDSGLISEKLNYTLFGATNWISQLESGSTDPSLYGELESGLVYDDPILYPTTDPTVQFQFALDLRAVKDINTAISDHTPMFAISGHADLAPGTVGSSVPEPSTWILMLAGFAGLGFVARVVRQRGAGPQRRLSQRVWLSKH